MINNQKLICLLSKSMISIDLKRAIIKEIDNIKPRDLVRLQNVLDKEQLRIKIILQKMGRRLSNIKQKYRRKLVFKSVSN